MAKSQEIVTLKKAIAVEVFNPILKADQVIMVRYLRAKDSIGMNPVTYFCTNVATVEKDAPVWYEDWYGESMKETVTIEVPVSNIEGKQFI